LTIQHIARKKELKPYRKNKPLEKKEPLESSECAADKSSFLLCDAKRMEMHGAEKKKY
jgi:hypothetical protein